MPKEKKHTQELQKQRQKLKEKGQKYAPGIVSLQVLGSGANGAPTSLYMFTDQSRYLFNVGEGSQRLAHEHKMKLSKLEHIFITNPVWENIGGLPGVALTIQDVGVPEITLHGPAGTIEIFSATQRFVVLKDLYIRMAQCLEGEYFEDTVMSVQYVPLKENTSKSTGSFASETLSAMPNGKEGQRSMASSSDDDSDDIDYYAHERKRKKCRNSKDRSLSPGGKRSKCQQVDAERIVMCYICRLKPKPGSLCLEKCVDKGVPPGPLLGRLKAGEDVQLDDGTLVRSVDVCLPDDPGPVFLVVDCPSSELVDSLVNNALFKRHHASATKAEDLAYLVVHFTPAQVMEDSRYREWMEEFGPSTQHLVLNNSNSCLGSVAVHRIQHKLHLLHKGIFPLLQDNSIPTLDGNGPKDVPVSTSVPVVQGRTLCTICLRPQKAVQRTGELMLDVKTFVDEALNEEGFSEELSKLHQKFECEKERHVGLPQRFPQVLFLGTGSCIPNKTRNTSGILLQTSEDCYVLVDCGEGTYSQLVRFFGPDNVDEVMRRIKAVYVSHLHADHHIGLIGVLKGRKQAYTRAGLALQPVYLFAPQQIMFWLSFYHANFEPILDNFQLVANSNLIASSDHTDSVPAVTQALEVLGMRHIGTVLVDHCPNAFGVAFTHCDGWKITYSGDTMPCAALVDLGQDSDLLIHEATMEDELVDEAKLKLHSTTSQAVEVGCKMGARFTLLTHFSQRYAKLPRFNHNFSENVGIAFDNMQVGFSDLPMLPLLYPSLKLMFAEHNEELEQKAARRSMRRERERASVQS